MIEKDKIAESVSEVLSEEMFLVDITISKSNVICIYIDSFRSLSIDDCVAVSRHVEGILDRDTEDFELQVSSPGVGQPFKVRQQYVKNVGRQVELLLTDGKIVRGKLESSEAEGISILAPVKEKSEKGKKPEVAKLFFQYDTIKSAMTMATF